MESINITPERFQQAIAWMNGKPSTLGEKEVLQLLSRRTAGPFGPDPWPSSVTSASGHIRSL